MVKAECGHCNQVFALAGPATLCNHGEKQYTNHYVCGPCLTSPTGPT